MAQLNPIFYMTEQRKAAITAKKQSLIDSLTGFAYQDAETLNLIRHYEVMISGESCGMQEDGCLSCGA